MEFSRLGETVEHVRVAYDELREAVGLAHASAGEVTHLIEPASEPDP
jgi:hypothetical protein